MAEAHGVRLSKLQLAALQLPNTPDSLACFAWLEFHFDMVGDCIPNTDGEIHLEPTKVCDIFDEYVSSVVQTGNGRHLRASQFFGIWKACFPHVKIREFKAVTGKCNTCAMLSDLRRESRDNAGRSYMTQMHWLHRSTYMAERMSYAQRASLAMNMPNLYLSVVSDGMAQNHCILPWLGNLSQLNGVAQHIQGVLRHGRGLTLYRTFHNVAKGANLQLHTFLLSLEQTMEEESKLPDTIFYQFDGGSENTAKAVLLMCELLIARGLTKKVVLTRLMVGHTHSDIDAVFGRLWTAIRSSHVHTQEQYRTMMMQSLSTEAYAAKVVDIYAVPDYVTVLQDHIDHKFGRYAKQELTQLQFTFEAVGVSDDFPLGVKTTYRAYASKDDLFEIIADPAAVLGMRARFVECKSFPEKTATQVEGTSVCIVVWHDQFDVFL